MMIAASLLCAAASAQSFVITDVRVFDGEKVIPHATLQVVDGRIANNPGEAAPPSNGATVNGAGKTLLPGLIDSHVHAYSLDALRTAAIFGVTTVLDMFTDYHFAAQMRAEQAAGKAAGRADLYSAGTLATAPGGHGTEYGLSIPTITRPEEAQAFVDARIAEGSDYIKIIYDDALEYGAGKPRPTISKQTLQALVEAAHRRGKLAVVHIGSEQQAEDAIRAGADGLAHLFVGPTVDANFPRLVADRHAFVIPTLTVLHAVCGQHPGASLLDDPAALPYILLADRGQLRASFPPRRLSCEGAMQAVPLLAAAHVPILAGTDAGNPGTMEGGSMWVELGYLVQAGLTPAQALADATSVPAKIFHLRDRGRLAKRMRADLMLVNGDPTANVRAIRDVVAVWKDGVPVNRQAWRKQISAEEAESKSAPAPPGSENGWISDFEDGKPDGKFGSGWMLSTDAIAGGKSTAHMEVVEGGAGGTGRALHVTGSVNPGYGFPWAGVMFSPGIPPMTPANLSAHKTIAFDVRGDGKTYRLMVFTKTGGYLPAVQTFVAGPEWTHVEVPFSKFNTDGRDVTGIVFCGGPQIGPVDFSIDQVRLQ